MKTNCHHCQGEVSTSDTVCPHCGTSLSVGAVLGHHLESARGRARAWWHRFWGGSDKVFTAPCPRCGEAVPFSATECPRCQLSTRMAVIFAIEPLLRALLYIRQFPDKSTPFQKAATRFCYFVVSGALFWILLLKAEAKFQGHPDQWLLAGLSAAIYVAVSFIVLPWLVPRAALQLLAATRPIFKLALFLNYITVALAVMIASDLWKTRSWLLISTFFLFLGGAYLFLNVFHPLWVALGQTLNPPPSWTQNNPNYRGRAAAFRPGKWS